MYLAPSTNPCSPLPWLCPSFLKAPMKWLGFHRYRKYQTYRSSAIEQKRWQEPKVPARQWLSTSTLQTLDACGATYTPLLWQKVSHTGPPPCSGWLKVCRVYFSQITFFCSRKNRSRLPASAIQSTLYTTSFCCTCRTLFIWFIRQGRIVHISLYPT